MKDKIAITSDRALAAALGVSAKTAFVLRHEDGLQRLADGSYDLAAARKLLQARRKRGPAGTVASSVSANGGARNKSEERHFWDVQWRKARAEREALKFATENAQVHETSLCVAEQIARELEFKRCIMSIPRLAIRLANSGVKEIEAVLGEAVIAAMKKLARGPQQTERGT